MRVITLKIGLMTTVFVFLVVGWAFVSPRGSSVIITGNENTVLVRSSVVDSSSRAIQLAALSEGAKWLKEHP